jgi:hypothetical protein
LASASFRPTFAPTCRSDVGCESRTILFAVSAVIPPPNGAEVPGAPPSPPPGQAGLSFGPRHQSSRRQLHPMPMCEPTSCRTASQCRTNESLVRRALQKRKLAIASSSVSAWIRQAEPTIWLRLFSVYRAILHQGQRGGEERVAMPPVELWAKVGDGVRGKAAYRGGA